MDGKSNRVRIQTNFSAMSLNPQELLTFIVDLGNKSLSLKQKDSCKVYNLLSEDKMNYKLPNIVDFFDLWSYVMYYN